MTRKINLVEGALVAQCALVGKDDFFSCLPKDQARYNQPYSSVQLALFSI